MEVKDYIVEEKMEFMIPLNSGGLATQRKAHFLNPIFNPNDHQYLPKLPTSSVSPVCSTTNITKQMVNFRGIKKPLTKWKIWVENMQKTHQNTWKKSGIFDAIRASTYHIKQDYDLIIGLAEKWCPQTNTFIFRWGEATMTLEDVMILGGFSVLGGCVKSLQKDGNDQEMVKKLTDSCAKIKEDTNASNVGHYAWMNYFKGSGGELENVALIALWLSRYVFSSSNVFSIAVKLARGTRIALAPAVLALVYRDLSLLKEKIVNSKFENSGSKLSLWAPFRLLQVWAWERFPSLGPMPVTLDHGEPRLARWDGVNGMKIKSLRLEIESAREEFVWRPYTLGVRNWEFPKFYCDHELWVLVTSEIDDEHLSFARCLRASELVGMDCLEQYLPHRVAMQFGMDQDIPIWIPRLNFADVELAWSSYDKPLDGLTFYLSPRLFEGDVTVKYSGWWQSHQMLMVSKMQRNYAKKVKRSTKSSNETEDRNKNCGEVPLEPSLQCGNANEVLPYSENNENVQDIVVNLRLEDDIEQYKVIVEEENKEKEVNNSTVNVARTYSKGEVSCSSSKENEATYEDLVGSNYNMLKENLFSHEEFEPQNLENEAINFDPVVMVTGLHDEENLERFELKADELKVVNNHCQGPCSVEENLDRIALKADELKEANNHSQGPCSVAEKITEDNEIITEKRPLIDSEMNHLLGARVEEAQHKPEEDADAKQLNTSVDITVVISDEEEDTDYKHLEAQRLDFETRMARLERIISALKAGTWRSEIQY